VKKDLRSISISHSITKTREEKDLTLKLEKDILNLEDIMNSAPMQTGMKMEKNAHNTSVKNL
jgi:hypothetical protein